MIGRGVAVLGGDGGAVGVTDHEAGVVRLLVSASLGAQAQLDYGVVPLDGPLGASLSARTGESVFLPDVEAGLAFSEQMRAVYETTGREAWCSLPLRARGRLLGAMTVSWALPRPFPQSEREILHAFAAQCAQALDRLQTLAAERAAAEAVRRMSETLQRSLLTEPPQPDHLHLEVRYRPAGQLAQVGGDWYDAFLTPDGATCLVVGDVTGHDRDAAAQMGALRNMLRATAYVLDAAAGRRPVRPRAQHARARRRRARDRRSSCGSSRRPPSWPAGCGWCAGRTPGTCRRCSCTPTAGSTCSRRRRTCCSGSSRGCRDRTT